MARTATAAKKAEQAPASAQNTAQLLGSTNDSTGMVPVNIDLGDGLVVTALRLTPANRQTDKGVVAGYVTLVFNRRLRVRGYKIWVPADRSKSSDLLPPVDFSGQKPFNYVTLGDNDRQVILAGLRTIAADMARKSA